MNELQAILESAVLSDEVKSKIQEAFEARIGTEVANREVKLAESYEAKKAELATSAVEMIEEAVSEEIKAIEDEIVEARTLDIRYALKLEEFKEQYAESMTTKVNEMVEGIVGEELGELKESLEEARNNLAGKRMFEAFQSVYGTYAEGAGEGEDYKAALEEAQKENAILKREKKLNELLEGVTGRKRSVFTTILEGVSEDKLEKRFNEISESVLLKEDGEVEEIVEESDDKDKPTGEIVIEGSDDEKAAAVKAAQQTLAKKRARRLAGLD